MPYEVRALDQICYIGSVYPLTAVAALAIVKPAEQPFRLSVLLDERDRLELRWSVATGYFLSRDNDGKPLKVSTARGEINDDPTGPTETYHREAKAYVDGEDLPESGEIIVTYQGCRENAVCYSPITKPIDLATHSRMQAE